MSEAKPEQEVILPVLQSEEEKMSRIECPTCSNAGEVTVRIQKADSEFEFLGLISCGLQSQSQKHQFPSRFIAGGTRGNDIGILPAPHTVDALGAKVESAGGKTVNDIFVKGGEIMYHLGGRALRCGV